MPYPDNYSQRAFDAHCGVGTATRWDAHDGTAGGTINVATALQVADDIKRLTGYRFSPHYDGLIVQLGRALGGDASPRLINLAVACLMCVEGRGGIEGDMAGQALDKVDEDLRQLLDVLG